jgi:hypothetical protein
MLRLSWLVVLISVFGAELYAQCGSTCNPVGSPSGVPENGYTWVWNTTTCRLPHPFALCWRRVGKARTSTRRLSRLRVGPAPPPNQFALQIISARSVPSNRRVCARYFFAGSAAYPTPHPSPPASPESNTRARAGAEMPPASSGSYSDAFGVAHGFIASPNSQSRARPESSFTKTAARPRHAFRRASTSGMI